uniref:T-box domain-containing protein n=1 Tax=Angiostrongylus cantonensis TaxID=6313 RepID=A0A0K0DES1_ANGCA
MEVSVRLANEDLWAIFHANTTEMVVTKTGRKMFPKLEYTIEGLKANLAYGLVLQIEQVDDNRYKFSGGEWSAAGRGESGGAPKNVMHHDGVMPGSHWMRHTVNFERVKITNNLNDANPSHIFLQSMHRYVPVLTIFEIAQSEMPFLSAPTKTEFIAVTAYQNTTITQLKIEHNPFAKGFRDGGERKRITPESCSVS